MATSESCETLEKGDIYFFYRPKVEEDDPHALDDVARTYVVLHADDQEEYRLLVLPKKALPDPEGSGRQRHWAFVDDVKGAPEAITDALAEWSQQTKTRGERRRPAARPAGEGRYRIVDHGEDHTHLVYSLELPSSPGEVQEEMNIEREASYILAVKNPEQPSPRYVGLGGDKQADYPTKLQEAFDGKRFVPARPPSLLSYPGAELVLIAASEDPEEELGLQLDTERETLQTAEMIRDLGLDRQEHPTKPLTGGDWS